ncbi:MAG: glycosyltransferase family 2 protein [Bauldia sp.]|nr:glycosyltransferase family 2 protein [Bauldia sp.]
MIAESTGSGRHARISVCIPHYNRMLHLLESLRSFAVQTYRDFEVVISDDNSTDERVDQVLAYLRQSDLRFRYWRSATNLGYDGNLRNAIDISSGDYILLMGNDDRLSTPDVMAAVASILARYPNAGAVVTNYRELASGRVFRRAGSTRCIGSGPFIAGDYFRNYSFVSGIVLRGDLARSASSNVVDGSEMYQMYLGTRLVAGGRDLIEFDSVCVDKDIEIEGEEVDSYRRKGGRDLAKARILPMRHLLRVVWAGLSPATGPVIGRKVSASAARQLYSYTFPFWGVEYRRTKSWVFAANVLLGVRPSVVTASTPLGIVQKAGLWLRYLVTCGASLLVPIRAFDALRPSLYRMAKR